LGHYFLSSGITSLGQTAGQLPVYTADVEVFVEQQDRLVVDFIRFFHPIVFLGLLCLIVPVQALADAKSSSEIPGKGLEVNPLLSFRQQMKEAMRDCRSNPNKPDCLEMMKRLRDQYKQLRDLCRTNPEDERCGSVMHEKKSPGWALEQACLENPHSRVCVKRRERMIGRDKRKRAYCRKNPDAKRCMSSVGAKRGTSSFREWCQIHADSRQCKAFAERLNKDKPKEEEQANVF
jgi:hypothetical protein